MSQIRQSQDDYPRVWSTATRGFAIREHVQQMNIWTWRGSAMVRRVFGTTKARTHPPEPMILVMSAAPLPNEANRAMGIFPHRCQTNVAQLRQPRWTAAGTSLGLDRGNLSPVRGSSS